MKNLKKIKKTGFTLVELIIVIAIIAVLAVSAFMMLTKWLGKSRDSRRLGDLGTIKKALEISYSDSDNGVNMYPSPSEEVEILDGSGVVMWTQGVFGLDTIGEMDNMQKAPQDPSNQSYYKYAVTLDKKEFQLGTVLEDGSDVTVIGSVLAANGEVRLDGNYDGYVSYPTTGGTMIFKTPSLLVKGEPTINVFSGSTDKFMVNGESEGSEIVLRSIKIDGDTSAEEVGLALGIDPKSAAIVLKNETGNKVSLNNVDLDDEAGAELPLTYSVWDSDNVGSNFLLSDNNLTVTHDFGTYHKGVIGTIGKSSGKWYWEITVDTYKHAPIVGIIDSLNSDMETLVYSLPGGVGYYSYNGTLIKNGTTGLAYGSSYQSSSAVIGVALDLDNGAIWFSKNGVWQGGAVLSEIENGILTNAASTGLNGTYYPVLSDASSLELGWILTANFGQEEFNYTVPSGFNGGLY